MIRINNQVPDLDFQVYQNDDIKTVRFSDYRGKWLALIFYPADFTFVCPTELEDAAQHYEEFKKAGADIISVSTDTVFVHKAWHDQSPSIKQIRYAMAADPSGKISRAFGTYIEETGLALRGSFIIDPDGVVKSFEINDLGIGRSAQELLRKLLAAKFVRENKGEVCPANWKPGAKTLKPGLDLVGKI